MNRASMKQADRVAIRDANITTLRIAAYRCARYGDDEQHRVQDNGHDAVVRAANRAERAYRLCFHSRERDGGCFTGRIKERLRKNRYEETEELRERSRRHHKRLAVAR